MSNNKNDNGLSEAANAALKMMCSKDPKERKQGFIGCLIIIIVLGLLILMVSKG